MIPLNQDYPLDFSDNAKCGSGQRRVLTIDSRYLFDSTGDFLNSIVTSSKSRYFASGLELVLDEIKFRREIAEFMYHVLPLTTKEFQNQYKLELDKKIVYLRNIFEISLLEPVQAQDVRLAKAMVGFYNSLGSAKPLSLKGLNLNLYKGSFVHL